MRRSSRRRRGPLGNLHEQLLNAEVQIIERDAIGGLHFDKYTEGEIADMFYVGNLTQSHLTKENLVKGDYYGCTAEYVYE